ncbi:MAG: ATP-dependent acyl-CoA ligase, partial [bacterium]|nr:ATP-dependent acyl-CoA ligase [bacterium]
VDPLDTDALTAWVGDALAPFKVPSLWEIRTQPLPRNASGKVLKNVLTGEAQLQLVEE